jgi:putative ABC transport system substrate-binding protein
MGIKTIVVLLVGLTLVSVPLAEAQQPKKVPRIGFLGAASASALTGQLDAFRQGLRELGYIEGKNIAIEYRYADGKVDRVPELAAELVGFKVDVIVTYQTPSVLALKRHRQQYLSSLLCLAFQSRMGSSPASRDRAGTPQG